MKMNKSEIETSKLNAISIHQSACMFHHIQRYHDEFRKNKQKIITDNQIQQYHSEIKNLIGRFNTKKL